MMPIDVIYKEIVGHPAEYWDWVKVMAAEALKTTLITWVPIMALVALYHFIK